MIYAFTGQPGAGKTLNAIRFVLKDKCFEFKDENGKPNGIRRKVYAFGIKGLNIPEWEIIDEKQLLRWWELEPNSVILVDEAQDYMRPRTHGKAVPEHIEKMEKHRHLGIDLVLTFQFPKQIDTIVRELTTDHFHYHRVLGLDASREYRWDYLCQNVSSKAEQEKAIDKQVAFDKSIYEKYQSATMHTATKRVPKMVYALPFLVAGLIWAGIKLWDVYQGYATGTKVEEMMSHTGNTGIPGIPSTAGPRVETKEQAVKTYVTSYEPRIKNVARSAPVYDRITQNVKSFPREQCLSWVDPRTSKYTCKCYSQQATRMNVSETFCADFVANGGFFDPTKEDTLEQNRERQTPSSGDAAIAPGSTFSYPMEKPVKPHDFTKSLSSLR